jgi:hypothetical protein
LNALFKPNFEDLDHINLLDAVRSTIAEQKAKLSIAETNFLVEKLIAPCSWSKGDENRFFEAYPSYSHLRNINVEYSSCAILFTQVRVLNRLFFHEMDVNLIHIPTLPKLILALLDISDDETQVRIFKNYMIIDFHLTYFPYERRLSCLTFFAIVLELRHLLANSSSNHVLAQIKTL